jgi:hypothetical protein
MTRHKCDYCRGPLGLVTSRYWGMRFCSKAHKKAYQHRLAEVTRAKIRHLALPLPLRRLESSPTRPECHCATCACPDRTQKREKPKETAEFLSHYHVPAIPGRAGKAVPCNP